MRIVSWNIRAGGGTRVDGIVRQIKAWQPDVVALCEFRGTPPSRRLAELLQGIGLVYQQTTADPNLPAVNALLLASRYPFTTTTIPHAPVEPYRWLLANLQCPTPFHIGAMHIPNFHTQRKGPFLQAVLNVAQKWEGEPAVFIGDTNSGKPKIDEESPAFTRLEGDWIEAMDACGWRDVFRFLNPESRAYTWYSHRHNGFRLDQAFIHDKWMPHVTAIAYDWGEPLIENESLHYLSDHAAIVLDVDVTRDA